MDFEKGERVLWHHKVKQDGTCFIRFREGRVLRTAKRGIQIAVITPIGTTMHFWCDPDELERPL